MRIVVTGASGFIGRPLIERLAPGHEVWVVGRHAPDGWPADKFVAWDLMEPMPAGALPPAVDAVIHLAQSREYRRFPERALAISRVNVDATLELLDYASAAGAGRFLFASSGGVYGGATTRIKEDARVFTPDFYLATKLAGEALAAGYAARMGVVTLRLFFVYGPGQSADRFFMTLVRKVLEGQPVIVHGNDGIHLNPIHVSDVARSIEASLQVSGSHMINVAGPEVHSVRGLTELIAHHVHREPKFEVLPAEPERDLVADIGMMERMLGAPRERFAERIGEVCDEVMAATR